MTQGLQAFALETRILVDGPKRTQGMCVQQRINADGLQRGADYKRSSYKPEPRPVPGGWATCWSVESSSLLGKAAGSSPDDVIGGKECAVSLSQEDSFNPQGFWRALLETQDSHKLVCSILTKEYGSWTNRGPTCPYSPCLAVVPTPGSSALSHWSLPAPSDMQVQASNAALNAEVSCCG